MHIDTLLARHDPASRSPLPGPDSAEAISLYREIIRTAGLRRTARSPRRRIAIGAASGAAAVLGAGLAAGLTLSSLPGGTHPTGPAPGHPSSSAMGGAIAAHLTARQVLSKAADTALSEPGVTPRPDQFVYTKVADGGGHVAQTWASVNGSRNGLIKGYFEDASGSTIIRGCAGGERKIRLPGYHGKRYTGPPKPKTPVPLDGPVVTTPCTAEPAFFPGMPASASAMPAYLRAQGVRLNDINDVAKTAGEIFQSDYLLPAQRAALYQFLATTPGLTVEHHAHDISGRPGIGVGWSFMGSKSLLIFDSGSYTLLGLTTSGEKGQPGGEALLQMAIVNQAGQRP